MPRAAFLPPDGNLISGRPLVVFGNRQTCSLHVPGAMGRREPSMHQASHFAGERNRQPQNSSKAGTFSPQQCFCRHLSLSLYALHTACHFCSSTIYLLELAFLTIAWRQASGRPISLHNLPPRETGMAALPTAFLILRLLTTKGRMGDWADLPHLSSPLLIHLS